MRTASRRRIFELQFLCLVGFAERRLSHICWKRGAELFIRSLPFGRVFIEIELEDPSSCSHSSLLEFCGRRSGMVTK